MASQKCGQQTEEEVLRVTKDAPKCQTSVALHEEDARSESLWEFLVPQKYGSIAKAAITVAMPTMEDEEDLKSPSNAIKLKYDVIRLVNAKWCNSLKEGSEQNKDKIAKYAINNGVMRASQKFTADMGAKVNESTVLSIRDTYLKVKKQGMYTTAMANVDFRYVHLLYFY